MAVLATLPTRLSRFRTVGELRLLDRYRILGLAGSLAAQRPVPANDGTLPTHRPLFVSMLVGVVLIVVALTYFPALALGPLAEGITR